VNPRAITSEAKNGWIRDYVFSPFILVPAVRATITCKRENQRKYFNLFLFLDPFNFFLFQTSSWFISINSSGY
jgi:hypothetical protein